MIRALLAVLLLADASTRAAVAPPTRERAGAAAPLAPAHEKQALVSELTSRLIGLAQYPHFRGLAVEIVRIRSNAQAVKTEPELSQARQEYEDWKRRAEPYLTGAASGPAPVVVDRRDAPQGVTARDYNAARLGLKLPAKPPVFDRRDVPGDDLAVVSAVSAPVGVDAAARKSSRVAERSAPGTLHVAAVPAAVGFRQPKPASGLSAMDRIGAAANSTGEAVAEAFDAAAHKLRDGVNAAASAVTGLLKMPLKLASGAKTWVTSNFGWRRNPLTGQKHLHSGVDLAAWTGTPVQSTGDGVVRVARWHGGYGKAVIIDHGNGLSTLYGHLSSIGVREGQSVRGGMVVALSGATGMVTGPHLHYETHRNGVPFDPMSH